MISLAIEAGVAIATLCRPPVNAINEEWLVRLDRVLDEVEGAAEVKVLCIRGRERVFCAGADLAAHERAFRHRCGARPSKDGFEVEFAETGLLLASNETQQRVREFLDRRK